MLIGDRAVLIGDIRDRTRATSGDEEHHDRLDESFTRRRMRRRLSHEDADHILVLVPEPDLLHELPRLFAQDLNEPTADHARIALLFDTHEAFYGEAIGDADSLIHADKLMRDEWLRCLLGHLDLGARIIAFAAGRIRPPWPNAPSTPALTSTSTTASSATSPQLTPPSTSLSPASPTQQPARH
ncbi:hypothetical protein WBK31_10575 [Nonomuraea sp. N2-4H]|uniref:hypothetical protein n=1 Tax=Nonomuraea sp. N2-4H TaxID=3128898 RepID=UPI003247F33D